MIPRNELTHDLDALDVKIEALFNFLYDHRKQAIPSCYDVLLRDISEIVTRIRKALK